MQDPESGRPVDCDTLLEDCVEPGCGGVALPEGSETTPVVLCSNPSSLPEFTQTSPVAPPPGPCVVPAGPGTDRVAQLPPLECSCVVHSLPGVYLANSVALTTAAEWWASPPTPRGWGTAWLAPSTLFPRLGPTFSNSVCGDPWYHLHICYTCCSFSGLVFGFRTP